MPGRILILDDNMTRRITLAARLSGAFYDIQVASSDAEAEAIIGNDRPGVILVADELACISATVFIRRLREDPKHANTTIFVLTAPGAQNGRADLLTAGADEVLPRSEPDEVFRARLRSHDRSRDMIDALRMRNEDGQVPGLSEAAPQFRGKIRVTLMAPEAEQAEAWREAIGSVDGFQICVASDAGSDRRGDIRGQDRSGVVLLGVVPGSEHRAFRMLADRVTRPEEQDGALLIFAPEADEATVIAGYEAGAGAVMSGPFDPAEVVARLRMLHDRQTRQRGLRRALQEGLIAAITDCLTGLYNRRYALPQLARLSAQAAGNGHDLAVMILDLDHFKQVNDSHGHGIGDIALQTVGQILQSNLRPDDLIARIGGEEFLVALPQTDIVAAEKIAERLCRMVRETAVLLPGKQPALNMTVSVGLVMAPRMRRSAEELIAAADKALYAAKGGGRDQVVLLPGVTAPLERPSVAHTQPLLTGTPPTNPNAQDPQMQLRI
ncbi:diguanylate cyclase [Pseudooceanicola sediminis]|uniref:diguanylate cyclase n=1 Tax=Pseudooceanicola sediminis TaxID=2211117 RepID=A0A399J3Q7_9RHOB|nr:diguanylate cyclase [Pseudooceanicola sediminis]KAA2316323.1 diguanylate cyclase [Puniceibacterium sp. HSS470]RII39237.1 diguanylate cyclase [Pseudooceanicola sediminis]|tara:strand:- start:34189 stop:35673 length:1485 start_codon:yes stop_codon:yes gene_type:complete